MNPYEQVIQLLEAAQVEYNLLEHEPVVTSEDSSRVTNIPPEQGAKALLLKGDTFVLCVVRGTNKLDYKKVRNLLGWRQIRFATLEEVEQQMGCQIGACYPFGELFGVPMLVDETLSENESITFSPGVHDKHIQLRWSDYLQAAPTARLVDLKAA